MAFCPAACNLAYTISFCFLIASSYALSATNYGSSCSISLILSTGTSSVCIFMFPILGYYLLLRDATNLVMRYTLFYELSSTLRYIGMLDGPVLLSAVSL